MDVSSALVKYIEGKCHLIICLGDPSKLFLNKGVLLTPLSGIASFIDPDPPARPHPLLAVWVAEPIIENLCLDWMELYVMCMGDSIKAAHKFPWLSGSYVWLV